MARFAAEIIAEGLTAFAASDGRGTAEDVAEEITAALLAEGWQITRMDQRPASATGGSKIEHKVHEVKPSRLVNKSKTQGDK